MRCLIWPRPHSAAGPVEGGGRTKARDGPPDSLLLGSTKVELGASFNCRQIRASTQGTARIKNRPKKARPNTAPNVARSIQLHDELDCIARDESSFDELFHASPAIADGGGRKLFKFAPANRISGKSFFGGGGAYRAGNSNCDHPVVHGR